MVNNWRIPVSESYVSAIGRATYNFSYLQWGVVCICEKLEQTFIDWSKGKTAGEIGTKFKTIVTSDASIPEAKTKERLLELANRFWLLVDKRNMLSHGNPITPTNGEQRLLYFGKGGRMFEWTETDIIAAAEEFETAAIEATDLYWKYLASL